MPRLGDVRKGLSGSLHEPSRHHRTACACGSFLVRASVADLGCAFRALGAIDVLHFFAVFVAVAITASAARDTVARAVLADTRKFTVGTMDAVVGSSVASLETFVGVLSDFPGDSR